MQSILITGASGGIGEATLKRLLKRGPARLGLLDIAQDRLNAIISKAGARNVELVPLICDLRDQSAIKAAIDQFADAGGLTHVFANAGVMTTTDPFETATPDQIDRSIEINFRSVALTASAAWAHLALSRGSMVINASGAGLAPIPSDPVYSASKAAAIMFARSNALRFSETGIRFNVVCPGLVDTPILNDPATGEWRDEVHRFARKFAIISPDEVAVAVEKLMFDPEANGEVVELRNIPLKDGGSR